MGIIVNGKVILADGRRLLRGKAVRIEGKRIAAIGPIDSLRTSGAGDTVLSFPDAAILPGLTNAHCHLELDWCEGKIDFNGNFIDWLQAIRDIKFGPNPPAPNPLPSIQKMIRAGTTTLIDHYTMDLPFENIRATGLRYFPFREMFEFDNHNPDLAELEGMTEYSYAVHAPYTASKEVALACRKLADVARRPLSTHLSEMQDEIDFVRNHNARIEQLLRKADAYDENWKGVNMTPVEYFYKIGMLNRRTYGVHLNYFEDNDLYFLKRSGLTPVYCPKSHKYFKHPQHPIETYQNSGIKVALGTDSLASNDALSIVQEARLLIERFPEMNLEDVMDSITVNGLSPLGLDGRLGRVFPGQIADLTIWPGIDGDSRAEIIHQVITRREETVCTIIGGKVCHQIGG